MKSTVEELAEWMEYSGLAEAGRTLFVTSSAGIPTDGDGPFTVLIGYGGVAPILLQGLRIERPSVQVTVRHRLSLEACAFAQRLLNACNEITNVPVAGTPYLSVRSNSSEPFDMGKDANGRAQFGFNLSILKEAR